MPRSAKGQHFRYPRHGKNANVVRRRDTTILIWEANLHRSFVIAVAVSFALLIGSARSADLDGWDNAYDAGSGSRFIPVELWTGTPWNGHQEIGLPPADLIFGKRNHKRIRGPITWTRPGTGEALQVYERINGSKRQLFSLRSDKTGLGRVYDSRYSRNCIDAIKFPLGR
jgi:hypothetical protein